MIPAEIKKLLIKRAQRRYPNETVKPCGTRPCLWDSFTIEEVKGKQQVFLWYNINKNTFCECQNLN